MFPISLTAILSSIQGPLGQRGRRQAGESTQVVLRKSLTRFKPEPAAESDTSARVKRRTCGRLYPVDRAATASVERQPAKGAPADSLAPSSWSSDLIGLPLTPHSGTADLLLVMFRPLRSPADWSGKNAADGQVGIPCQADSQQRRQTDRESSESGKCRRLTESVYPNLAGHPGTVARRWRGIRLSEMRRRSQVAKAADCKSATVGSTPTGAS